MNPTHPQLIFVYGTLKRGGLNHAVLAGQTYAGEARLTPGFVMYSLGEYPGLVAEPGSANRVTGEIWSVDADALLRLDALEGVEEGLYARVPAPLEACAGRPQAPRVEMYLYLRDVTGRPRLGETWPMG